MFKWFSKLVLALTLISGSLAAVPSSVEAHTPPATRPQVRTYYVYYRFDCESQWVCYGYTQNLNDARYYANWIYATYGYESYVR